HRARPPRHARAFPYTTLFRSLGPLETVLVEKVVGALCDRGLPQALVLLAGQHDDRAVGGPGDPLQRVEVPRIGQRIARATDRPRSEEHTSELQSRENLVCRLL